MDFLNTDFDYQNASNTNLLTDPFLQYLVWFLDY